MEKEEYKDIINQLMTQNKKLTEALEDSLNRSQEAIIKTAESTQGIVESYNKKEKAIIITVIITIAIILIIVYLF